jgi:hypothetical protein
MTTIAEVESFLRDFKTKLEIWDVLFLQRPKNLQALADLNITAIRRKEILKELEAEDYSEGPVEEVVFQGSDMWIFGKTINQTEVYIKITLGKPGKNVLCISFHPAEHPMNYPFKS